MNDSIKKFLSETNDVCFGYNEINFSKPEDIKIAQVGFKYDENGNLYNEKKWKDSWIVIATDNLGDPIFIDESLSDLPVFTAQHGEGSWDEIKLASSLSNFKEIILLLEKISKNRENPVQLNQNPMSEIEIKNFIEEIEAKNDIDPWWWELFIESDDE